MATTNGSTADLSDLDMQIIRQIEYYFGDYNLIRDKFLQQATKEDDGWISFEKLLTFNRLKKLCTDTEAVVSALKKSVSGLLEVHETGTKIRRSKEKPLPTCDDKRKEEIDTRSVYVKGFPTETVIDDLLKYFKQHGDVEHIQMRYLIDKKEVKNPFKGSVFVVFPTKEQAESFQKKENVKYKDTDLLLEMKEAYNARKKEERANRKIERKKEITENNLRVTQGSEDKDTPAFVSGCLLHLKNLNEESKRETIREVFETYAEVAWVDYNKGLIEATIRFKEPMAQEVIDKVKEKNDGKLEINGVDVEARILEGEEETKYWEKVAEIRRKQAQKGKGRGRGRFGRGGKFQHNRGQKRSAEEQHEGPSEKKQQKT